MTSQVWLFPICPYYPSPPLIPISGSPQPSTPKCCLLRELRTHRHHQEVMTLPHWQQKESSGDPISRRKEGTARIFRNVPEDSLCVLQGYAKAGTAGKVPVRSLQEARSHAWLLFTASLSLSQVTWQSWQNITSDLSFLLSYSNKRHENSPLLHSSRHTPTLSGPGPIIQDAGRRPRMGASRWSPRIPRPFIL